LTDSFDLVAPHMRSLQKLELALARLDVRWEVIETTARIVCPREAASFLPTLAATRASFSQLAGELIERIAAAHLDNRLRDLSSRAQVAIDILIRNLYERTADVGFIATDSPLVDFVRSPSTDAARALRARLAEYRAKYTVYSDIVVLSADGRVLLRLADSEAAWSATPHWWAGMLAGPGHVERFEPCALFGGETAHYYAHRIASTTGQPLGAVLLRFDFESEMVSVFADLLNGKRDTAIAFIDEDRRVFASSRPQDIAPGSRLAAIDEQQLLGCGGQDWLAQARATRGYQGYRGLPWQAVAMIRVDAAFRVRSDASKAITAQLQDDDQRLRTIVEQARRVEDGLHRVVWNGKLARTADSGASSVHAVFDQIAVAGRQTTALFAEAIGALKSLLRDGRCAELAFHASLAVRIMDRNLYERANDCRWWALSPDLAAALAALSTDPQDAAAKEAAQRVLAHLNSLYTVYRRVALFDRSGRVLAVSKDADTLQDGLQLDAALVQRVLSLPGTASYAVSRFDSDPLADGLPTYLYCAAVRSASGQAIGGVALAFNADAEFLAMLKDALPDGEQLDALLIGPEDRVISSTDPRLAPGQTLPFTLNAAPAGHVAWPQLVERDDSALLAGVAVSEGYREFKRQDGYVEPVRALIFHPLPVEAPAAVGAHATSAAPSSGGERRIAVVACGSLLLGFDAADVVEAVSAQRMVCVARGGIGAGLLEYGSDGDKQFVTAIDMGAMCGEPPAADPRRAVAVIVRQQGVPLALLVDRLVHVIEHGGVQPPPQAVAMHSAWISGVLSLGEASNEMVYLVDPLRLQPAHRTAEGSAWPDSVGRDLLHTQTETVVGA